MPRIAWDKERIVDTLRQLHKRGEDLSYNKLAKRHQSLVSAAAYHFGSYRKAGERPAGASAPPRGGGRRARQKSHKSRRWSGDQVKKEGKSLYRAGKHPATAALRKRHSALYGAATGLFGGIPAALAAAGVKK